MGMQRVRRHGFLRPHAVQVVAVGHGGFRVALGIGRAGQSSAAGPGEGPIPAIIVSRGVAAAVVGDGVAVVGRQLVLPAFVAVGIAVGLAAVGGRQKVSGRVVGEGIGRGAVGGSGELPEGIVGIGPGLAAGGLPGDIARGVVGKLAGQPVCPAKTDGIAGNTGGGAGCSGGVGVGSAG